MKKNKREIAVIEEFTDNIMMVKWMGISSRDAIKLGNKINDKFTVEKDVNNCYSLFKYFFHGPNLDYIEVFVQPENYLLIENKYYSVLTPKEYKEWKKNLNQKVSLIKKYSVTG